MLSRVDVMRASTLQEATYLAGKLVAELQLYSDAAVLVPKTLIQELMPDRGWNDTIRDDKTGECFRRRVADKLIASWKRRKAEEIALEVSDEVEHLVKEKLKKAGVSCASMESHAVGVWRRISRPGRKSIYL